VVVPKSDLKNGEIFACEKCKLNHIPLLKHMLQIASVYARTADKVSGQVMIESKNPSPYCDPKDTDGHRLVQALVDDIRKLWMEKHVIIESFGPDFSPREKPNLEFRILHVLLPRTLCNSYRKRKPKWPRALMLHSPTKKSWG